MKYFQAITVKTNINNSVEAAIKTIQYITSISTAGIGVFLRICIMENRAGHCPSLAATNNILHTDTLKSEETD